MRFFTPELYVRFNSADDDVADRADEAWEKALKDYRAHLSTIRNAMPSAVRKVSELSLHDAEVLRIEFESLFALPQESWSGPLWSAVSVVTLQMDRSIYSLIYTLWDRVREYPAPPDWRFSRLRKHWLYDEVDLASEHRGTFLHRILFSDGSVLEIPFLSAIISVAELHAANGTGNNTRRSPSTATAPRMRRKVTQLPNAASSPGAGG